MKHALKNLNSIPFLFLTTLLLSFVLLQPLQAQPPHGKPPHGKPFGHWQQIAQDLSLSDEQTESFMSVLNSQHEKRREIMKAHRKEREEKPRAEMEALHQETISLLASVLSAEQLQQFEDEMEAHRKHRKMHKVMR